MPDDRINERVERLEEAQRDAWRAIERLADKQAAVDDVLVTLTEAQIKTAEAQIKTEEHFRESGSRIDSLVSAIGELIQRIPPRA